MKGKVDLQLNLSEKMDEMLSYTSATVSTI